MNDHMISLEEARAAKEKAKTVLCQYKQICGIGITRQGGSYAVQVNLESASEPSTTLPDNIDGVPVIVRVVGQIHKR